MSLEQELSDIKEELREKGKNIEDLTRLQMKHENLDEIRAVKQDQLNVTIQTLCGNLKDYQKELHEVSLKNTEDISKMQIDQSKLSTRVKILWGIFGAVGVAVITVLVEKFPAIIQALAKGN